MEEKKKPNRPISVIYADAKQAITRQVGNTMAAYGLPIFMAEGILSGVLAEIRANAANELADDTARYEEELKAHYEAEMKEKQEAFEKEKEDLITLFENPDLPGTTPEGNLSQIWEESRNRIRKKKRSLRKSSSEERL